MLGIQFFNIKMIIERLKMITVNVNNNSHADAEYDEFDNYNVCAEFQLSDEACATDAMRMFNKAMLLEGYLQQSVYRAMVDFMLDNDVDVESIVKKLKEE